MAITFRNGTLTQWENLDKNLLKNAEPVFVDDAERLFIAKEQKEFTAVISGNGTSNAVYVRHNNTDYYTGSSVFSFNSGDTIAIYAKATSAGTGTIIINSDTVASSPNAMASYIYSAPNANITIALSSGSSASTVTVTEQATTWITPREIMLVPETPANDGTYYLKATVADGEVVSIAWDSVTNLV